SSPPCRTTLVTSSLTRSSTSSSDAFGRYSPTEPRARRAARGASTSAGSVSTSSMPRTPLLEGTAQLPIPLIGTTLPLGLGTLTDLEETDGPADRAPSGHIP